MSKETTPDPTPARSRNLALLGVVVAAVVGHLPALRGGYILDDDDLLVSNPYVRTLGGLRFLVTHELFVASAQPQASAHYRPLAALQYWISWQLFAANPIAQHAYNLVLHGAVAAALLLALEAFGTSRRLAAGIAVLFALHPATAMTVAYVGGRMEMLGWLFFLLGLAQIPRVTRASTAALLVFATTLLATHCREPLVLAALALPLAALAPQAPAVRTRAAGAMAGGIAAIGAVVLLRSLVGVHALTKAGFGIGAFVETAAGIEVRLAQSFLAPVDLAMQLNLPELGAVAGALALLAAGGAFVGADRMTRHAPQLRALAWASIFALSLTVSMTAVNVLARGFYSDRYAYGLFIELALLSGAVFQAALPAVSAWIEASALKRLIRWLPAVCALALVPLTWSRDVTCGTQELLKEAMMEERPNDPESWFAKGILLFYAGDLEAAFPFCNRFAKARPRTDRADMCVGSYYLAHRRPGEALPFLSRHAKEHEDDENARESLLVALFAVNDLDGVRANLSRWEPRFASAPELIEAHRELDRRTKAPRAN